ncbi:hypothetical protein ACSVIJ_04360 [Pseudomonas sp. NCHU5208]|uniref:hypothetical protein n=1 Tax=unclassified Pseudomonas TaxID=196821 RepID=UPI003F9615DD
MNRLIKLSVLAIAVVVAAPTIASPALNNEDDQVRSRNQQLESMRFKRDQLKLQAEMATSVKQMIDAGQLVDENGQPLGVESFQQLGIEVRERAAKAGPDDSNPFASAQQQLNSGMPFSFEQPSTQSSSAPAFNAQSPKKSPSKGSVEFPNSIRLIEVRADSVVVKSGGSDRVLRIGDKINDLTLIRFDASRAYMKGPSGTEVLSIDWSRSSR